MQLHSAFHRGTQGWMLAFCWGGSVRLQSQSRESRCEGSQRAPAITAKEGRQLSQARTAMVGSSRGEAAYTSAEVHPKMSHDSGFES